MLKYSQCLPQCKVVSIWCVASNQVCGVFLWPIPPPSPPPVPLHLKFQPQLTTTHLPPLHHSDHDHDCRSRTEPLLPSINITTTSTTPTTASTAGASSKPWAVGPLPTHPGFGIPGDHRGPKIGVKKYLNEF